MAGGRRGERKGCGGRRKKMAPTGGPHLSAAERERRGREAAGWAVVGLMRSWAAAGRVGLFSFFFFSFLFKSNFKPIKFKTFSSFQI
jgi:hypothetical protein